MKVTLDTERILLRELQAEDFAEIHGLRSDPAVARYMDFAPESEAETRAWLDDAIDHNRRRPRSGYNFAIVRKMDGCIVGWIGFGRPSEAKRGGYERELDFGYALRAPYWGQGYMTEALRAVLSFAFAELHAQYVFGECDVRNPASARVMAKAGMQFERVVQPQPAQYRFGAHADRWKATNPSPE